MNRQCTKLLNVVQNNKQSNTASLGQQNTLTKNILLWTVLYHGLEFYYYGKKTRMHWSLYYSCTLSLLQLKPTQHCNLTVNSFYTVDSVRRCVNVTMSAEFSMLKSPPLVGSILSIIKTPLITSRDFNACYLFYQRQQ